MKQVKAALERPYVRFAVSLSCALALAAFNAIVLQTKVYGSVKEQRLWKYPQAFAAFAYHGSPLFSAAAAAMILLVVMKTDPTSSILAALLRSKIMVHLSKVFVLFFSLFSALLKLRKD